MEFNIGDEAWWAGIELYEDYLICPHCFGKKFLTVILGDDSQVTIECYCCREGYYGSQGRIKVHQSRVDVRLVTITGKEQSVGNDIEYRFNGYYCKQNDLFSTKLEADVRAVQISNEYGMEEMKRYYSKDKHDRNWAYQVIYHRNFVKSLKKDLDYHESKLIVAKSKCKNES